MKTDMQLQQEVMNELQWEPSVNAAEIGVAVKDGAVTLSGLVDSFGEKHAAERSAARIHHVKAIADEIQVRLPGSLIHSDEDIAREAANILAWNTLVPHDTIKIIVQDAWVTMTGEVNMWYQRWNAEIALHHIAGIRGITNEIEIKPKALAAEVRSDIEQAFERSGFFFAVKCRVITVHELFGHFFIADVCLVIIDLAVQHRTHVVSMVKHREQADHR